MFAFKLHSQNKKGFSRIEHGVLNEHSVLEKVGLKAEPNSFANTTSLGGSLFKEATKTLTLKTLGSKGGPLGGGGVTALVARLRDTALRYTEQDIF